MHNAETMHNSVSANSVWALGQFAPKLPNSSSGSENQDFESWLRRFGDMIRMINPPISDQLKTNALVGFLDGEARDLIDDMTDSDKNDYYKVVEHLRSHYESKHFRGLARQKLSDCKQNSTESVRDFVERIKKLVKKATIGQSKSSQNERLLDEFLDRLKLVLRFHVKATSPATLEEALVKALTYESLLADTANALTIIPVQPTQTAAVNVAAAYPAQFQQQNNFARRARPQFSSRFNQRVNERAPNSNIVCYRCGRQGHIQMYCRYTLPPTNLRPPRGQLPNRYQSNRPPITGRTQNFARGNQRPEFRNSDNARSFQYPNPRAVYAVDTSNAVVQESAPNIDQQKDAQIKALIERNQVLAQDFQRSGECDLPYLVENFHINHPELVIGNEELFKTFKERREATRNMVFTGTDPDTVRYEHDHFSSHEGECSDIMYKLVRYFFRNYKPNVFLTTISTTLNLTAKKGIWRKIAKT
ncbi:hypothetical protein OESDEN_05385 [Oesophagostomum dentatum]|uniref:CCHC-type domain-containing protein n=1 Tax=Oesophagostomum dentatum TaxID=61180 RepID=A0A0B1TAX0_OESDE|nr:hypothetical protein OESDEN_05385 [Oesophagostomum dentatum]